MAQDHLAAPQPLEEHHRLAAFAGEWAGEEAVFPSRWNAGGTATSKVTARIDLDGFYLIQDTRQFRDGKESSPPRRIHLRPRRPALQIVLARFAGLHPAGAGHRRLEGQYPDAAARSLRGTAHMSMRSSTTTTTR